MLEFEKPYSDVGAQTLQEWDNPALWRREGKGVAFLEASILQAIWKSRTFAQSKSQKEVLQPFISWGREAKFQWDPNSCSTNLFCLYPQANDFSQSLGSFLHTIKKLNQMISL